MQKSVREHGAKHPAHQGLVAPWSNYQEMLPANTNGLSTIVSCTLTFLTFYDFELYDMRFMISEENYHKSVVPHSNLFAEEKEVPISGLSRPNVIVHSKSVSNEPATQGWNVSVEPLYIIFVDFSMFFTMILSEFIIVGKRRRLCSSSTIPPPRGFVAIQLESLKSALNRSNQSHVHKSLARWKNTLNLMAKVNDI